MCFGFSSGEVFSDLGKGCFHGAGEEVARLQWLEAREPKNTADKQRRHPGEQGLVTVWIPALIAHWGSQENSLFSLAQPVLMWQSFSESAPSGPNRILRKRLMPYCASLSHRPHLGPEDRDGEEGRPAVINAHVHGLSPLLHLQDEVCGLTETKAGDICSTPCSQLQAKLPHIPPSSSLFPTHPLCTPVCAVLFSLSLPCPFNFRFCSFMDS